MQSAKAHFLSSISSDYKYFEYSKKKKFRTHTHTLKNPDIKKNGKQSKVLDVQISFKGFLVILLLSIPQNLFAHLIIKKIMNYLLSLIFSQICVMNIRYTLIYCNYKCSGSSERSCERK